MKEELKKAIYDVSIFALEQSDVFCTHLITHTIELVKNHDVRTEFIELFYDDENIVEKIARLDMSLYNSSDETEIAVFAEKLIFLLRGQEDAVCGDILQLLKAEVVYKQIEQDAEEKHPQTLSLLKMN